ncbi:MAG TPA: oxaloacetate decarboxylase subunit alpha [Desulfotomaculum sp.]|nr:oxaloacetate decarboxylase subunit alpha [Desulfotomaculum sp.]
MHRLEITDTTLRDGQQSLLATRMRLEDMLPICEKLDQAGFHSLEVWGGATFDSCLRFLKEDPWERLSALRKHLKTPLQMLLRGQNLVGYKHHPDDVLNEFIKMSVFHGIDIFRVFDALNDVRNVQKAVEAVKKEGAHAQGTVVYTISPFHNNEYYVKVAKTLENMGADSICIKDMAGLLAPQPAYDLIRILKSKIKIPLQLHCHCSSGLAPMAYLRAIEAGVDVIDCAISTMAMQSSLPSTETIAVALKDTPYETAFDLELLYEISEYFKEVRKKYSEFDVSPKSSDTNVMVYQIPGGMISNFITQLSGLDALHRLPEVLVELLLVRKDFGYPPLVTPTSQIIGAQAVSNVLFGRYLLVTSEVKRYMLGYYGQPPAPVNEDVRKQIIGQEKTISCRPADLLEPGLPAARSEAIPYMEKEEDVLSVALFPETAMEFLQERLSRKTKIDFELADVNMNYYPA